MYVKCKNTNHQQQVNITINFVISLSQATGRLYDNYEGLLDQVKFHSKIIFTKQHLFNCSLLNFGGKLLRSLAKVSIFGHTCKYSYVSYRFLWHGYLTNCWWSYFMAEYQFLDDYILGYEIVNEPWCGDVYEVPFKCIRRKSNKFFWKPSKDIYLLEYQL